MKELEKEAITQRGTS